MKRILIITILTVLFILTSLTIVRAETTAELKTSSMSVKPGDTFTVTLYVECADGVSGIFGGTSDEDYVDYFEINYDNSKLDLISKEAIKLMDLISEEEGEPISKASLLTFGTFTSGDVLNLNFKVKDNAISGETEISTTDLLLEVDSKDVRIPLGRQATTVEIESVIDSDMYTIIDQAITNIQPNENYTNFIQGITTNSEYTIKEGEKVVKGTDKIKTGQTLIVGNKNYTLIVTGDTDGNGKADILDIMKINKHRLNKIKLSNAYFKAGDVNKDGKTDILDILKINKFRLGKIKSL